MKFEPSKPARVWARDIHRVRRRKAWLDAHGRRILVVICVVLGVLVATSAALLATI